MTKILATIGPISESTKAIKSIAMKTNLFRLNGSHNNLEWHFDIIKKIRNLCPNAFILMDIPGIKPRTANDKSMFINKGNVITFGELKKSSEMIIPLTKPLPYFNKKIREFSINDGQFYFELINSGDNFVTGKSKSNFELLPKKGLNISGSLYDETKQKKVYLNFIDKIKNLDIDGLGLSFVQTGNLVREIKEVVPHLLLISKIENSEGLKRKSEIILNSDGIMIDRGDLAAEIGNHFLFNAVETISKETKKYGKPLIMATENLNSMIDRLEPSKSEIISLGHSLSIGVDCIMLSEETATSINFLNTIKWISNHSKKIFQSREAKQNNVALFDNQKFPELWSAVRQIKDLPIVLLSKSGYSLFQAMSLGQSRTITLFTDNKKIISLVKLFRNKINVIEILSIEKNTSDQLRTCIKKYKSIVFDNNEKLIAIYVSHYINKVRANNFSLFNRDDFD
jgi:pyruvate kinase